ncbi:MAG: hypothetical protein ACXU9G_08590, partial [Syntrophales bacterium]
MENSCFTARDTRRDKTFLALYADSGEGPPVESRYRVDPENPMLSYIVEVILNKNHSIIYNDGPVEIMKYEKSREPEPGAPEGIRNPGIKVIEIR